MTMPFRPYICECTRSRCRATMWLTHKEYVELARMGNVVSRECATTLRSSVVGLSSNEAVVVVRGSRSGRRIPISIPSPARDTVPAARNGVEYAQTFYRRERDASADADDGPNPSII